MNINLLEERIKYSFNDKKLISQAVTHRSYGNDFRIPKNSDNERLEFLGDAVLELAVSEFLYSEYSRKDEGDLTKIRASIVCEPTLAQCARQIGLPDFLFLGRGEEMTGGRDRDSTISDAMEAVIGAIYIDGGLANAKEFINEFILKDIENKQLFYDSKTILQEEIQKRFKKDVKYGLVEEKGPDHRKEFTMEVRLDDDVLGTGTGKSKKSAEQKAAYEALTKLKKI